MKLYISNDSNFEDVISELYRMFGYSTDPLFTYKVDGIPMDYEGFSQYATKFNLKQSDILIMEKVLKEAASFLRANQKPMMATGNNNILSSRYKNKLEEIWQDSESLIQTRQAHMLEVAIIAEIISNALGLNKDLVNVIGIEHDIGHSWNGHSGERILSEIGKLNDSCYFVHSAMAAYVLKRENIINRAINELKTFNPKIESKAIEEFIGYVIDGIVSHNGEGVIGKIIPKNKTSEEMVKELRKCFTEQDFDKNIMPATMEGAVIRYADIIAYTRSDILDGFRLKDENGNKILNGFDDEYLSIIGTVLARQENNTKMLDLEHKLLLEINVLSNVVNILNNGNNKTKTPATEDEFLKVKNMLGIKNDEDLEKEIEMRKKELEIYRVAYKQFEESKIKYARHYIEKIEPKSDVKIEVTDMMQNVFIRDLVETSRDKSYITMSPLMRRTLFSLRTLNIKRIVPYTRRKFELEILPKAVNGLVDKYSNILLKTGIAYNYIPNEYKNTIEPFMTQEEYKANAKDIHNNEKANFKRKIYHHYQNQDDEGKEYIYEDVLAAMEDITKNDIEIAIGNQKIGEDLADIYEKKKIDPIREKIKLMGKQPAELTKEDKEKLMQELLLDKHKNIEKAIATRLAIEYIGGMTDKTILTVLLDEGLVSRKTLEELYNRQAQGTDPKVEAAVRGLRESFEEHDGNMIRPDDKKYKGIDR